MDAGSEQSRLEREAFVGFQKAAAWLLQDLEELLAPYGISPPQYNVLRILRGAGPDGLAPTQIGERMITRDPDITRLLNRLEASGLVSRTRGKEDRRVVVARISADGTGLLKRLDAPVARLHSLQFARVSDLRSLLKSLGTILR